ncbi:DUF2079 domain-containing protein [Microbispora sp. H10836]|uniref:DUF2079 domain-containing protein n=1 Tax=Microbispora sp. H10836 TaxID=2729106 RepID=UPI001473C3DA|nr:DUF2079 domain-containing protein [Microbispora sp. H10836]
MVAWPSRARRRDLAGRGPAATRRAAGTRARGTRAGGNRPDEKRAGEKWTGADLARVSALTVAAAALYAFYSCLRLARFRAGAYDLVIFDQAIRSYARLQPPVSMLKGVHNGFGPGFCVLGDHWSPALALLAPLYRIHDGPATLLVAQAVLLALSIPFVWVYAFRASSAVTAGRRVAYPVAVAYALSWPIAEAVAFDFHEVAFVPLLTAAMLERYQVGRRRAAVLAGLALLLVKEDMGLLLAGFGLFLLTRRCDRIAGALLVAGGAAATLVATSVLIPHFGGRADYYWAYWTLGPDLPRAVVRAVTRPGDVAALLADPPLKLRTLVLTLAPVLFTAVLSPLGLTLLPPLLERMLASTYPNWWTPRYHYTAFVVAVVFAAGVDGALRAASRSPGRPGVLLRGWALLALAVAFALVPFFSFGALFTPGFYTETARTRAAERAVAAVPEGALVEAADSLAPALSPRTRTLLWDRTPRGAPWVAADVGARAFPFGSVHAQVARVEALRARGYRVVFREAGYVVLSRR